MPLEFRAAAPPEHGRIEKMVIDSFEPITWFKKLDARIGLLNGRDWRMRWQARMRHVFETETVLVGESGGEIVAMSSGTFNSEAALAYIDLIAVDGESRPRGYGREMLRARLRRISRPYPRCWN